VIFALVPEREDYEAAILAGLFLRSSVNVKIKN